MQLEGLSPYRRVTDWAQGYFQLSSMSTWGVVDRNSPDSSNPFNLQEFYNNIIALFEGDDVDAVWVRETLAWWDL